MGVDSVLAAMRTASQLVAFALLTACISPVSSRTALRSHDASLHGREELSPEGMAQRAEVLTMPQSKQVKGTAEGEKEKGHAQQVASEAEEDKEEEAEDCVSVCSGVSVCSEEGEEGETSDGESFSIQEEVMVKGPKGEDCKCKCSKKNKQKKAKKGK